MIYGISYPKIKERVKFFHKVSFGPINHIVPSLTLLTNSLIWIKYIFSCLLHKNINLESLEDVNEMILNPQFGAYHRVLVWSYEYACKNIDPPSGILVARNWNYGTKARENNRDFFSFTEMGRFIKDFLDIQDPDNFLKTSRDYFSGNITNKPEGLRYFEERFRRKVIGVNLPDFPVESFFMEIFKFLKREHFEKRRDEFVSLFITSFLKKFRETSNIEKNEVIRDHPIHHYVNFISKELGITSKEDLLKKLKKDENSLRNLFPEPETLEPKFSDNGFDAILLLKLIKDNAPKHFYSFIIATYLKKRNIDFKHNYLGIYKALNTQDFKEHIRNLEKTLSQFGLDFCLSDLDIHLLKNLAIWWEYYQFAFIGEAIVREINGYLLENLSKDEIRKRIPDEDLEILTQFLKNYKTSTKEYLEVLQKDENSEEILSQLDEMEECTELDTIFEHLFKKTVSKSFGGDYSYPFFPSLDSFQKWVDEILQILKQ